MTSVLLSTDLSTLLVCSGCSSVCTESVEGSVFVWVLVSAAAKSNLHKFVVCNRLSSEHMQLVLQQWSPSYWPLLSSITLRRTVTIPLHRRLCDCEKWFGNTRTMTMQRLCTDIYMVSFFVLMTLKPCEWMLEKGVALLYNYWLWNVSNRLW